MNARNTLTICLTLFAGLAATTPSRANTDIYRQLVDASVFIFNADASTRGSATVIDAERRLAVTNYHVVAGSKGTVITFLAAYDGDGQLVTKTETYLDNFKTLKSQKMACVSRVVGVWPERDLALVQIDECPGELPAIPLAADSPAPGETIHSVGNPAVSDSLWVYSPGRIRQVYHHNWNYNDGQQVSSRIIETTSPINGGDSGSGVVNDNGELVGVNCSHGKGRLMTQAIDIRVLREFLSSYGVAVDHGKKETNELPGDPTHLTMTPINWPQ